MKSKFEIIFRYPTSNGEETDPKRIFLNENIFQGLKNLNDGFDACEIKYFGQDDFRIVLQRVEKLGLGIYGIEPWQDGEFYDCRAYEEFDTEPTDPNWYNKVFEDFVATGDELQYAASYYVPEELLK